MNNLRLQKNIEKIISEMKSKKKNSRSFLKYKKRLEKKFQKLKKVRRVRYNSYSIEKMFSIQSGNNIDLKDVIKGQKKNIESR